MCACCVYICNLPEEVCSANSRAVISVVVFNCVLKLMSKFKPLWLLQIRVLERLFASRCRQQSALHAQRISAHLSIMQEKRRDRDCISPSMGHIMLTEKHSVSSELLCI